jgi:LemA protein
VQATSESLRRHLVEPEAVAELGKADAVLAAVMVRLVALAEQQGDLQSDAAVQAALKALRELPPRLAFARQMFNDAGAAYNQATQQFPTRLLASLYRFGQAGRL